jgi:hypothetical protein
MLGIRYVGVSKHIPGHNQYQESQKVPSLFASVVLLRQAFVAALCNDLQTLSAAWNVSSPVLPEY